jgi:hypothetical protein
MVVPVLMHGLSRAFDHVARPLTFLEDSGARAVGGDDPCDAGLFHHGPPGRTLPPTAACGPDPDQSQACDAGDMLTGPQPDRMESR